MKKYIKYFGLIAFTCFSFYYTEKVTKIMNSKDPVMKSIEEFKENNEVSCKEGYITSEGAVLGVNGQIVDVFESYSAMQGVGYDEELMVYKKSLCKVNLENTLDNYIIKANEITKSVSLFINIVDTSYLKEIIDVTINKGVLVNLIVTGNILENNKEYMKQLYLEGYELIYGGKDENDFKKYINIMKEFKADNRKFCININTNDILKMCSKEKINSLKTNNVYNKDILLNTKKNLQKGEFYVYKENANTLKELSATINYIEGKELKIVKITELLT